MGHKSWSLFKNTSFLLIPKFLKQFHGQRGREAGFYVGCHIKYNGFNPIQNTPKKKVLKWSNLLLTNTSSHLLSLPSPLKSGRLDPWPPLPPPPNPLTQEGMNEWGIWQAHVLVTLSKIPVHLGPIHDALYQFGYSVFCLFHSFVFCLVAARFSSPKERKKPPSSPSSHSQVHKFSLDWQTKDECEHNSSRGVPTKSNDPFIRVSLV